MRVWSSGGVLFLVGVVAVHGISPLVVKHHARDDLRVLASF